MRSKVKPIFIGALLLATATSSQARLSLLGVEQLAQDQSAQAWQDAWDARANAQTETQPTPSAKRINPVHIPEGQSKIPIEEALRQQMNCLSSARSAPQLAALTKHMPSSQADVTLAQLADASSLTKTGLPLVSQYEELTRACDSAVFSALNEKAPAIVSILKLERSQEQDAWVGLIQRKFNWGGFNQRLKAIYADGEAKLVAEKERILLAEEQAVEAAALASAQFEQAERQARALAQQQSEQRARQATQDAYMARMAAASEAAAKAAACANARAKYQDDRDHLSGDGALAALTAVLTGIEGASSIHKACN